VNISRSWPAHFVLRSRKSVHALSEFIWPSRRLVYRTATKVRLCSERARSRRELQTLDDYALRDIGLTRADVWREASKPRWRA